jgi:serine/threonine-protein kinase
MNPLDRESIGRYRIVRPLGIGGMAEALLCELPSEGGLHKRVVVKRIHPHLRSETEIVAMLQDEARITLPLMHSNIATTYELGRDGDDYYLVCEYVEGADLGAVMARAPGPLPVSAALAVTVGVLEGLAYAHDARDSSGRPLGIVHRDVTPANILLARTGDVKLADFGVARAQHRLRRTIDGVVRGTLAHMSPEQARGEEVDRRGDLYSLGTVLWRMLSGTEIPGVTGGYGVPPLVPLRLGEPIDRLLWGALAVRVEDRFRDAAQMSAAARHALVAAGRAEDARALVAELVASAAPAERGPASGGGRRTEPTRVLGDGPVGPSRRRWASLAAATLALALLAIAGVRAFSPGRPAGQPRAYAATAPLASGTGGPAAGPRLAATTLPAPAPVAAPAVPSAAPDPGARPEPRGTERPARHGTLDLHASPWAYVEIDGRRVGTTPRRGVAVAAGSHEIRFVNPELGRSKQVRVEVLPSVTARVSVDLEAR